MKRIILIPMVMALMVVTSCKKYLTAEPKTQITQDELFDSESGFKDALTGVYIQMKNDNSYGGALTQSTIEALTNSWDASSGSIWQYISLFNYSNADVQSTFANIWAQQYTTIASINAILEHIDEKKSVFQTAGLYELIKGECLALRAYIHLDILRLYGPVPTASTGAAILPYVTVLSTTPTTKISFAAYQTALYKDMLSAENLLQSVDPIYLNTSSSNDFLLKRNLRMNYYAVKALEARAYLWFGDKTKAYECAKVVIAGKNADGTYKLRLGTASDFLTAKDYVLTAEHIFGLYDFQMLDKYTTRYASGNYKKGSTATTIKTTLYGNTGTDIRETYMWTLITLSSNGTKCYIINKYSGTSSDYKQIPMLRLSEMYLIAAEAAPYGEGIEYFKTFRTARNIGNLTVPATSSALGLEILKEYRKEFYAEGQGFYAYKRINAAKASMIFASSASTVNYVVPTPSTENQ